MRYIRPRPWRPRGPWLNGHPSVRRRGHHAGEWSTSDVDGVGLMTASDDHLIAEQPSPSLTGFHVDAEPILPARIDEAGLLAARMMAHGDESHHSV